jgi:hypothetical protein
MTYDTSVGLRGLICREPKTGGFSYERGSNRSGPTQQPYRK